MSDSAPSFIVWCCLLLTTPVLVDGRAVISVRDPLNVVARRPSQFSLSVRKTGNARSPATIIVEVCRSSAAYTVRAVSGFNSSK